MADVVLKDLEKVFDKNVPAVRNVNLEIKDQEFVVLVGPSGCGKSTFLLNVVRQQIEANRGSRAS